jgi:hypothetical protein
MPRLLSLLAMYYSADRLQRSNCPRALQQRSTSAMKRFAMSMKAALNLSSPCGSGWSSSTLQCTDLDATSNSIAASQHRLPAQGNYQIVHEPDG